MRLNVSPKTTSQRIGCTARVNSSVRSWLSFCSSTRQNVPTRLGNRRQTPGAIRATSANALRRPPGAADLPQAALRAVARKRLTREAAEHVLERRVGPDLRLQLVGGAHCADHPQVHERHAVAEGVGLL